MNELLISTQLQEKKRIPGWKVSHWFPSFLRVYARLFPSRLIIKTVSMSTQERRALIKDPITLNWEQWKYSINDGVCVCVWSWKKQKQKPCGDFFGVISRFSFSGPRRLRERWRWLKCQTNFRPPSRRRDPVTLARTGSRQGPSDKHFKLIWIYFNHVCFIPSPDKTPEFILLHLRSHGLMKSKGPKFTC